MEKCPFFMKKMLASLTKWPMKFPEEFHPHPLIPPAPISPHPSHSPPQAGFPGWFSLKLKSFLEEERVLLHSIQVVCSSSNLPCPSQINALCVAFSLPTLFNPLSDRDGYHYTLAFPHGAILKGFSEGSWSMMPSSSLFKGRLLMGLSAYVLAGVRVVLSIPDCHH